MNDRPAAGHRVPHPRLRVRLLAVLAGVVVLASGVPSGTVARTGDALVASRLRPLAPQVAVPSQTDEEAAAIAETMAIQPSILYEEAMAHAGDAVAFEPGGRVEVGFHPARGDRWEVDGRAPTALPAGRASGREIALAKQGSVWAQLGSTDPPATTDPAATVDPADAAGAQGAPATETPAAADPEASPAADETAAPSAGPDASVVPSAAAGLRKQVLGFLPYWEVDGANSTIDYDVLSTIAYFSVGTDKYGNLMKRSSTGALTTGWAGWTSAGLTSVINTAHRSNTRVVLTVTAFAWTSTQAATQRALLGSSTARLNLARQVAAAVRDRGADGVNLDFEPLASGYEAEFVALLKSVRSEMNKVALGYQLTYDTTGYAGNYPLESSIAAGAADAIFIMGYDYRTAGATYAGSIDPLAGPAYDLTDTVRSFTARVPGSKVILGIPWYGRAWSTVSDARNARTQTGAKYGYSAAVNYSTAVGLAAQHGRRWDSREFSAYIAYRRQNCTSTYGCVTTWRQVYYDDPASLKLRYDLVNRYGLRGAGIWALGYQGTRTEMWTALKDKFLLDRSAPEAGVKTLPTRALDEGIVVTWDATDQSPIVSYDVQVSADGGAWTAWLTGTKATSDVFLGRDGHGYAFRVRATDSKGYVSAWNVSALWRSSPTLAKGGFGRVQTAGLAYRAGPDLSAQKLGELAEGTIVAVTNGPVSADGYSWIEVSQPLREWGPVSFVERGVWIAAGSSTVTHVVAWKGPHTTTVDAGLAGFGFGQETTAFGTGSVALAARSFSPNGDGSEDTLRLRWTNGVALDALTLNVHRPDGSLVGSRPVAAIALGPQTWDWDGTIDGSTRLPDGQYALQLVGTAGTTTYRAPSARPVTTGQLAAYAVTLDTVSPEISGASVSSDLFSPNGDGVRDTLGLKLTGSGGASRWVASIAPATGGAAVRTLAGSGAAMTTTWDGRTDTGTAAGDRAYRVTLTTFDAAGNGASRTFEVTVDTRRPVMSVVASPLVFSPNGDGFADTTALRWSSDERGSGTLTILTGSTALRRWTLTDSTGGTVTWDGRTSAGTPVVDGPYRVRVSLRDRAGNLTSTDHVVTVDRTLRSVAWSRSFYPQDGDTLAPNARLSFVLARSAAVTLRIVAADGTTVRTVWTDRSLGAGTRSWVWDGRVTGGAFAAPGRYAAVLSARSSLGTTEVRKAVVVDAFSVRAPASATLGTTFTVTFRSLESLGTTPVATFTQPGKAAVARTATRLSDGTFRVSFTVASGATGSGSLRITAKDVNGGTNSTILTLAVIS